MPFMKWDERFVIGIKEVDEQHKKLVDLINELYDAVKNPEKSMEVIDRVLKELIDYAHYHFSTEEKLMEQYNYPELEMHKKQHNAFKNKVQKFLEERESSPDQKRNLTLEVMKFLKDWLILHIMGVDKKFGPYIITKMNS